MLVFKNYLISHNHLLIAHHIIYYLYDLHKLRIVQDFRLYMHIIIFIYTFSIIQSINQSMYVCIYLFSYLSIYVSNTYCYEIFIQPYHLPAIKQCPKSNVNPKLLRLTSCTNICALPVDGTAKNLVFSSVGLYSKLIFNEG